ncbi:MAG: hypothetical protein JXB42_02295 [Deltaproteobacteria bacterium]|nr:hypothetical protein [Deltaproteobacteria bacterium]
MSWTAIKLTYQARSPLHIGFHTLGYIQRTRYYIPGRTMWGACTANLTRAIGEPGTVDYKPIGEDLFNKHILLSYFYPLIESGKPLIPRYKEDEGLCYGDYPKYGFTEQAFEKKFIRSFGQTAILPETNTAEDNSLHESEFIVHEINNGSNRGSVPTDFAGYVLIRKGTTFKNKPVTWDDGGINLKSALSEIFVGGDRKYGWGRLTLKSDVLIIEPGRFFDHDLTLQGEHPIVTIKEDLPIPAHLPLSENLSLKGDIEPLVGREWGEITNTEGNKKNGAGQKISSAKMCWVPGSILNKEESLTISSFGILKGCAL